MNVFEMFAKLTLDKKGFEKGLKGAVGLAKDAGSKVAHGVGTMAKATGAALGVAAAGAAAITKSAVNAYSEYEQLVGGAQLMYGDAYSYVSEKAKNAYATVQMSANDYLTQVNGFATGLKTALGGNEQAAAELADKIVTAEADIVSATGASQESIQNAFNGIMKSNFTMLDNLQLGITPTKEGFEDLIKTVNAWNAENGNATNYTIKNVADCQAALVDYVKMQGMAGYASAEGAETIQGSLASLSGAWQNLLVGLADNNADLGELIDNLVESASNSMNNIIPIITKSLSGIGKLVQSVVPIISEQLPILIPQLLPHLLGAALTLLNTLVGSLPIIINVLTEQAPYIINTIANALVLNAPTLIMCAIDLMLALAEGLIEAIPQIVDRLPEIVNAIKDGISEKMPEIKDVGKRLIEGLWNGISDMIGWIKEKISGFGQTVLNGLKDFFGIHSPSRKTAELGRYLAQGFGVGFDEEWDSVKSGIEADLGMDFSKNIAVSGTRSGLGGTTINMTINAAEGMNVKQLADEVADRINRQLRQRRAVTV